MFCIYSDIETDGDFNLDRCTHNNYDVLVFC